MARDTKKLLYVSLAYIVLAMLGSFIQALGIGWAPLIFIVSVLIGSIYMLMKFKDEIGTRTIWVGALLGGFAGIYGMAHGSYFDGPFVIVMVMAGFWAGSPVLRKYLGEDKLIGKSALRSIGIGIILGIILGIINMKLRADVASPAFTLDALAWALKAGIWEEVGIRYVFYALGILILKGSPKTKDQSVLLYILMAAPHTLGHGLMDPISFIVLMALFGLPMSILQRKVDLTSAIIMHTLIDLIRFVAFGA